MLTLRPPVADPLVLATLLAVMAGCAAEPLPVHHPLAGTIQSPCDHQQTFQSASRDRLNHLRSCGAIDDEEWSCLGTQLDYLGEDVRRRCDAGRLSYTNIAGEQQRRYATCIVPFDPALVDCGLFATDLGCGKAVCDSARSLPATSAAPRSLVARSPQAIARAGSEVMSVSVHGYQGACDFRLDSERDRARLSEWLEGAIPGSVVAHEVRAEFYLRFTMKDGSASEFVVGERWIVPPGGSRRDTVDGWRLSDRALRDYLRQRAARCG
jgi:hypothetical protein